MDNQNDSLALHDQVTVRNSFYERAARCAV